MKNCGAPGRSGSWPGSPLTLCLSHNQDVNAGEGSEFTDSGIEGAATDTDLLSRRSNATTASYSPPASRAFIGSDSGSSSAGDGLRQGVYENFRRELEMSTANSEHLEEAGSALSDEQSSGTLSSPGQSDILLTAAQGTVRKAGALAVKNFLVHKKNKKVESATRRKWKHYWVSLKGTEEVGRGVSRWTPVVCLAGWRNQGPGPVTEAAVNFSIIHVKLGEAALLFFRGFMGWLLMCSVMARV